MDSLGGSKISAIINNPIRGTIHTMTSDLAFLEKSQSPQPAIITAPLPPKGESTLTPIIAKKTLLPPLPEPPRPAPIRPLIQPSQPPKPIFTAKLTAPQPKPAPKPLAPVNLPIADNASFNKIKPVQPAKPILPPLPEPPRPNRITPSPQPIPQQTPQPIPIANSQPAASTGKIRPSQISELTRQYTPYQAKPLIEPQDLLKPKSAEPEPILAQPQPLSPRPIPAPKPVFIPKQNFAYKAQPIVPLAELLPKPKPAFQFQRPAPVKTPEPEPTSKESALFSRTQPNYQAKSASWSNLATPKLPKSKKINWLRVAVIGLGCALILSASGCIYLANHPRGNSDNNERIVPSLPNPEPTPTPPAANLPAKPDKLLTGISTEFNIDFAPNSQILTQISQEKVGSLEPSEISQLLLKIDLPSPHYLTTAEIIQELNLRLEPNIAQLLDSQFNLFLFNQAKTSISPFLAGGPKQRLGLVFRLTDPIDISPFLDNWQIRLLEDLSPLFLDTPLGQAAEKGWQANFYQTSAYKSLDLPYEFLGLNYAWDRQNNLLIFTTCQDLMKNIITHLPK